MFWPFSFGLFCIKWTCFWKSVDSEWASMKKFIRWKFLSLLSYNPNPQFQLRYYCRWKVFHTSAFCPYQYFTYCPIPFFGTEVVLTIMSVSRISFSNRTEATVPSSPCELQKVDRQFHITLVLYQHRRGERPVPARCKISIRVSVAALLCQVRTDHVWTNVASSSPKNCLAGFAHEIYYKLMTPNVFRHAFMKLGAHGDGKKLCLVQGSIIRPDVRGIRIHQMFW